MTRQLRTGAGLACLLASTAMSAFASDLRLVRSTSGSRGSQQGGRFVIEDPRSVFSAASDRQVIVLFEWEGAPGTYRCEGRWKDPSGKVVLVSPIEHSPKSRRFSFYWTLALAEGAPKGLWALEVVVEGQVAATHTFQVADAAGAAGAPVLSSAEIYRRGREAVGTVERLGASGELLGQGPAVALDGDLVATSFRSIESASKLRLATAGGFRGETSEVAHWDRRQGYAVLRFPGHGLAPLPRAAASPGVGERCFVVDTAEDGGRVIAESGVVGREAPPLERPRLGEAFASGSPVIDAHGALAGMVVAAGEEESLGAVATLVHLGALRIVRSSLFLAAERIPSSPTATATLAELLQRGEFLRPLSVDQRQIVSGVFSARVERGGATPRPLDQRMSFSRVEKEASVFVQWLPTEKRDATSRFEVYDADYKLLGKSEPVSLKLRKGEYLFSTWTFHIDKLPAATYRVDLLLDESPAWRGYVKVTE